MNWVGNIFFICITAIFTIIYGIVVTNSLASNPIVENFLIAQDPLPFAAILSILLLILFIGAKWLASYLKQILIVILSTLVLLAAIASITSGQFLAVVAFLLVSAIALLLGYFTAQKLKLNMDSVAERLVINTSLGLGLLIMIVFILGIIGWLQIWIVILLFIAIAILTFRQLSPIIRDIRQMTKELVSFPTTSANSPVFFILIILISIPVFVSFLLTLNPETMTDAIYYQLQTPAVWAEQGQIVQLPWEHRSYYPKGINMLFALGTVLTSDETIPAHLFVWEQYLLLIGIGFLFGHVILKNSYAGLLTAAFIATTPLIIKWTPVGYIEVGTTWASFITIYLWFKWYDRPYIGWAIPTGYFAGIAMFAKPQAIQVLLPLAVIAIVMVLFSRQRISTFIKHIPIFLISALATALPWMILVYAWTGNPVFRHLNSVFQSPYAPPNSNFFNYAPYGLDESFESLIRLPIELVTNTEVFVDVRGFDGELGPLSFVWLLLPFSIFVITDRRIRLRMLMLLGILLGFTLIWFYSTQYLRFYMYIVPILALVTGISFWAIRSYLERTNIKLVILSVTSIFDYLVLLLVSLNVFLLIGWWSTDRTGFSLDYLLGNIDRETQLQNTHDHFNDAFEFLKNYPEFEPVVLSYRAVGPSYYDPQSKIFTIDTIISGFARLSDDTYLARLFEYVGASHLLVRLNGNRYSVDSGTAALPHTFVDRYLIPEYVDNQHIVFRFFDKGITQNSNVIWNNTFDQPDSPDVENLESIGEIICATDTPDSNCYLSVSDRQAYNISSPVEPDQMVELRFESTGSGNLRITIQSLDDQGQLLNESRYVRSSSSRPSSRSLYFDTSPQATHIQVEFRNISGSPLNIDNIQLFELELPEDVPTEHVALDYDVVVDRWQQINICTSQMQPASGECLRTLLD